MKCWVAQTRTGYPPDLSLYCKYRARNQDYYNHPLSKDIIAPSSSPFPFAHCTEKERNLTLKDLPGKLPRTLKSRLLLFNNPSKILPYRFESLPALIWSHTRRKYGSLIPGTWYFFSWLHWTERALISCKSLQFERKLRFQWSAKLLDMLHWAVWRRKAMGARDSTSYLWTRGSST